MSANRFRTTRYTNDQSNEPSLDDGTSAEPNESDAFRSRGRLCEPYELESKQLNRVSEHQRSLLVRLKAQRRTWEHRDREQR